ncbi:unnamed protein product [Euphydryas editha]|uniref:Tyr recombinase domain-containing protein n=1 Tax=Euphydryas editha TaxID=104508 RepID=A0AAU9TQB9_EUPED|nr:unnamed protein product [Euphydryas editha]
MPPIWDPKLVIQYLMHNIPDVTNLYQVLRRTAILLLLSSGRRVHDLTLLSIEDGRYIDQELSKERRQENNLVELFITARGVPKAASRTVIGGWIKSVLREAGVEAPPGSVRSAVASRNWLENFSVEKILETGNWKQVHTFQKYYMKVISNQSEENCNVSLSNYFNSIR